MLINKTSDMTPYDTNRKPCRQNVLLLPLIWTASWLMTRCGGLKIDKSGIDGLNPPYIVFSQHQGFSDYYITPLALFPHRANYVSDVEGFAAFGNKLYRQIGCIPTRRFVTHSALIRNIRHVVEKNRDIIVIYPEARHSNAGTNTTLPESTGKLVKLLGIPVVVQRMHGSYLTSPIWDEEHRRKAPLFSTLEKVLAPEDINEMQACEITALLNKHFRYDEYQWQLENRIQINCKKRAEGLHKILYLCPNCHTEYTTKSHNHTLECTTCGKQWEMDAYGSLSTLNGRVEFSHIPNWYDYERQEVLKQIERGDYRINLKVTVEALPNEKGFVVLGEGQLFHSAKGFELTITKTGESLYFSSTSMFSVHTEYNYRGKGDCIVLSTKDCCYYLYPDVSNYNVTKIQFAAEAFYRQRKSKMVKSAAYIANTYESDKCFAGTMI